VRLQHSVELLGGVAQRGAGHRRSVLVYGALRASSTNRIDVRASAIVGVATPDCVGTIASLGYNRFTDTTCAFAATGDARVGDLGIGGLANNGGPTRTRLPTATSTLLNAIPAGTAGACDAALPTDQRGQPRPQGVGCDIGAVERTP
jgi:hypothetical protein